VRWGIVGTGGIPAAFAADLRGEPKAGELLAVASRGSGRAEAFDRVGSMIGLGYPFEEPR
jgi:predicted dehydrogenase